MLNIKVQTLHVYKYVNVVPLLRTTLYDADAGCADGWASDISTAATTPRRRSGRPSGSKQATEGPVASRNARTCEGYESVEWAVVKYGEYASIVHHARKRSQRLLGLSCMNGDP